ncbi:MAG: hypothetical protein LQ343_001855 [Gyalolechia ehrenbergii]|nr:MAG: hypothetical protein LQ343_001855 [Gyalolechia ehrenbergii]
MSAAANRMAAKVAESATKAVGKAAQSGSSGSGGAKKGQQTILRKGAKRDPELYVRHCDPITSNQTVGKDEHFKYQYHPGGDPNKAPKKAPSALNSVIIPNVTLPKSWHDQFNKWGKDEYDF